MFAKSAIVGAVMFTWAFSFALAGTADRQVQTPELKIADARR